MGILDFLKGKAKANPDEECYAAIKALVEKHGAADVLDTLADVIATVGLGEDSPEDKDEVAIELQAIAASIIDDDDDDDDGDEEDDDGDEEDDED